MNSRIIRTFALLRAQKKTAFMPFLVAGYPTFEDSVDIAKVLAPHAHVLEIGFPFSDPLADGPTIQAADQVALKQGMDTDRVFEYIRSVRKFYTSPIVVLVYANIVYQKGIDTFYEQAKVVGVDGILVPDAPFEEIQDFHKAAQKYHIDQIFLVSQTTSHTRLKRIVAQASGFLYLVSILGVTGVRKKLSVNLPKLIRCVKRETRLPVVVGFGIATQAQVRLLKRAGADGIIIGSALVQVIQRSSKGHYRNDITNFICKLN